MDYGILIGLLIGAGVGGHSLRIVTLYEDDKPDGSQRGRYEVAVSAIIFYTISAILVGMGSSFGLVLSIIGPMLGVTAVLLLKQKIDLFQIVLGVFQFMAIFLAIGILLLRGPSH